LFAELQLDKQLLRALEKLGLETPTEVQSQTIPLALAGSDLLVNAHTGSGKTAAFLLPSLHKLLTEPSKLQGTRLLVLSPTRELARQLFKNCKDLIQFCPLQVGLMMGGDEFKYQRAMLRKDPEILIATPGRLLEHIKHEHAELSNLEVLVLDEGDRMLDMGLSDDVLEIVRACKPERQTMLFSATLAHTGVRKIAQQILRAPKSLTLSTAQDQHSNIRQQVILTDGAAHKDSVLTWLLSNEKYEKALIFTNTRDYTNKLGGFLRYHNIEAGVLHGEMEQDARNQIMTQLRYGKIKVLVATDVAARGLDVKGIDLVINVDMARSGDDYIHRVGRTGRAGESGTAITFISAPDWNLMSTVEHYLQIRFEKRAIKGLEAAFKGPKKIKNSGKAAGSKVNKEKRKARKEAAEMPDEAPKTKQRLRDKKNIGKRRAPSKEGSTTPEKSTNKSKNTAPKAPAKPTWGEPSAWQKDGWAPMKKKKKTEE